MMATCRYSDMMSPSPPPSPSDKLQLSDSAESMVDELGYYVDKIDSDEEDDDDRGDSQSSESERSGRSGGKYVPHKYKPPHLVARRNARERRRVEAVNSAFIRLRKVVPYENRHKRLSKAKTLRTAINYIRQLQQMINRHDGLLQTQQTALGYQHPGQQHLPGGFSPDHYHHPADQCAVGTIPGMRPDSRSYLTERSQTDNLSNTMLNQFADHVFRHASHLRMHSEVEGSNPSCLSPGSSYTENWIHQHTIQGLPLAWPDAQSPTEKMESCYIYSDIKPALSHPSSQHPHHRMMTPYISS